MDPAHIGLTCPAGPVGPPPTLTVWPLYVLLRPGRRVLVLPTSRVPACLCWAATLGVHHLPGCPLRDRDVHLHCIGVLVVLVVAPSQLTYPLQPDALARLVMDGRININATVLCSGLFCPVHRFLFLHTSHRLHRSSHCSSLSQEQAHRR